MVEQYQKSIIVEAIQFESTDKDHIDEIIDFVDLPISVDYTPEGVRLRVIRGAYDVAVAYLTDYLFKDAGGRISVMKQADFEAEYEPVGSG